MLVELKMIKFESVSAHCDIPCKVYDPYMAQYAAISVLRLIDLINEMPDKTTLKSDLAKLNRLVAQKEEHAHKVKEEVATIWGDYFKQPKIVSILLSNGIVASCKTIISLFSISFSNTLFIDFIRSYQLS